MPIKVNSQYGTVSFPDDTSPDDMAKAMRRFENQQIDKKFQDTQADIESSFFRGVGRGAVGLVGLPGTAAELLQRGVGKAEEFFGLEPLPQEGPLDKFNPTGENLQGLVEKATGPWEQPKTTAGRYMESIGEQVPGMFMGPGGPVLKVAGAITGGIGSEAAGELTEGTAAEPWARAIGGALGGEAAGMGATRSATRASKEALTGPRRVGRRTVSGDQIIEQAAKQAYKRIENADYAPDVLNPATGRYKRGPSSPTIPNMDKDLLATILENQIEHHIGPVGVAAPKTVGYIRGKLSRRKDLTIADILRLHEHLGNIGGRTVDESDLYAATITRDALRDWLNHALPGKTLQNALGNWAMHAKIEEIQKAIRAARIRAGAADTGANFENQMRQKLASIFLNDDKIRGYPQAIRDQIERAIIGGLNTNILRWGGRFSPARPHVSGVYSLAEWLTHKPMILFVAGVGLAVKPIGEALTRNEIERIITMLQEHAPINAARPRRAAGRPAPMSVVEANAARNAAALSARRAQTARSAVGGFAPRQPDTSDEELQNRVSSELEHAR